MPTTYCAVPSPAFAFSSIGARMAEVSTGCRCRGKGDAPAGDDASTAAMITSEAIVLSIVLSENPEKHSTALARLKACGDGVIWDFRRGPGAGNGCRQE